MAAAGAVRTSGLARHVASDQEQTACDILWFYQPIIGLTGWDDPPANLDNSAAWDFSGGQPLAVAGIGRLHRQLGRRPAGDGNVPGC